MYFTFDDENRITNLPPIGTEIKVTYAMAYDIEMAGHTQFLP